MPTNSLTDAKCRAAKPAEKDYKLFDGGGLYLFVTAKGAKVWRLSYRLAGKPKTKSLGPYPEVSLAEARAKRDEEKAVLRAGDDPMAGRVKRKGITFAKACETYWSGRKDISPSYRNNARRGIEMHLLPWIGEKDFSQITRDDLLSALNRMDAAGKHSYVRKVRMWAGLMFEWAIEQGYAQANIAASIRPEKAFAKESVESFAALELRDVPEFIRRLDFEADLLSVQACRLLAYTWVRTSELRFVEPSELDLDAALWVIPARRTKKSRDHVVPLSRQAVDLFRTLIERKRPMSKYIFQHPYRNDRPMSENAVLYLIARIGYKSRMTGHGWRSVGSTWANDRGYNEDAIEMQLAHVPENKVRAVYNRARYLEERRAMLQDFADWLDSHRDVKAGVTER